MKILVLSLLLAFTAITTHAQVKDTSDNAPFKLKVSGGNACYQKTVKVDSLMESVIYNRALQFLATKNFQQNYGYQQEGKLIFNTTQDLNINSVSYTGDDEMVDPYTVQFAITLDIKNKRYRYTISNVIFFVPTETGSQRLTLFDVYSKAINTESKRIAKEAKKMLASFEKYLTGLTDELYNGIEQKPAIYDSKF